MREADFGNKLAWPRVTRGIVIGCYDFRGVHELRTISGGDVEM